LHIQAGEKILSIPKNIIITSKPSDEDEFGRMLKEVKKMPNTVAAGIHLLYEKHKNEVRLKGKCMLYLLSQSLWKPYIDVLPKSISTTIYFSKDEIPYLQSSMVRGDHFLFIKILQNE
jgi:hypothetical protein